MDKQPVIEIFMLILSILAMLFFFTTARAATPGSLAVQPSFGANFFSIYGAGLLNLLKSALAF